MSRRDLPGAGKSKLLNILGGLGTATEGHVGFRDRVPRPGSATGGLTGLGDSALTACRRDHAGFVFQFCNLVASSTARENMQPVTDVSRGPMRPEEAPEMVGLPPRLDHLPAELSGGAAAARGDRPRHRHAARRASVR